VNPPGQTNHSNRTVARGVATQNSIETATPSRILTQKTFDATLRAGSLRHRGEEDTVTDEPEFVEKMMLVVFSRAEMG